MIEVYEPSEVAETEDHRYHIHGRLTERGMFFLEGNRKMATVINATSNQHVLDILHRDEDGHEERVALSPYISKSVGN